MQITTSDARNTESDCMVGTSQRHIAESFPKSLESYYVYTGERVQVKTVYLNSESSVMIVLKTNVCCILRGGPKIS